MIRWNGSKIGNEVTILRESFKNYERRSRAYQKCAAKAETAFNRWYRWKIFIFWGGLFLLGLAFMVKSFPMGGAALVLGIFLFIAVDVWQVKAMTRQRLAGALETINANCCKRLNGEWSGFQDQGADFQTEDHQFAGDLDVFGPDSLFQWLNTAGTFHGRRQLARWLTHPPESGAVIRERQEAVTELAGHLGWRQRLMAEAVYLADLKRDPETLIAWANDRHSLADLPWLWSAVRLLPIVTAVFLITAYLLKISFYLPGAVILLQYLLLRYRRRERESILERIAPYHQQLQSYAKLFEVMESRRFQSSFLVRLQTEIRSKGRPVYRQIQRLAKIADAVSNRHNAFYFFLNVLTLWDYQCFFALADWKERSGSRLRRWFEVLGEMEALASLAVVRYDHPAWAIPGILEGEPVYLALELGHPLLPENRVCNDLVLNRPSGVLLVTGSNMSGKSTFLRTAGINLILAYAGSPVCARELTCSLMEMHTCMRVGDNLSRHISSFYAEVLRVKQIVDAAAAGHKVFFLLDEIFKGTNSKDRHTGARILIKKLSRAGAIGMVSTHDLELADLEEETGGRIKNCHFQEQYREHEILFDFKLRPGVSTTRNALYLLRAAGITVDDPE
ncbi:MutS family DNA mismatch repair protein [Hydrogenispora ethanolica]|uniref:MutS family DNA mismatch repair protein n=1 Tax=Hydrogenispora ethanolica TaxID=1082276 RepID=UPI00105287E7|nr:MutS family DNA mismatch repair protein [Hydrogenispora ethanolica]